LSRTLRGAAVPATLLAVWADALLCSAAFFRGALPVSAQDSGRGLGGRLDGGVGSPETELGEPLEIRTGSFFVVVFEHFALRVVGCQERRDKEHRMPDPLVPALCVGLGVLSFAKDGLGDIGTAHCADCVAEGV
jgi:hypothetical protein